MQPAPSRMNLDLAALPNETLQRMVRLLASERASLSEARRDRTLPPIIKKLQRGQFLLSKSATVTWNSTSKTSMPILRGLTRLPQAMAGTPNARRTAKFAKASATQGDAVRCRAPGLAPAAAASCT